MHFQELRWMPLHHGVLLAAMFHQAGLGRLRPFDHGKLNLIGKGCK